MVEKSQVEAAEGKKRVEARQASALWDHLGQREVVEADEISELIEEV